jgi:hypothetical protein
MPQGCQFLRYAFLPCQGTTRISHHLLGLLQRLYSPPVSGHSLRVSLFIVVHKLVAHCVYDTSLADSAVKLVCTTVTFIDVLHVFTAFLIVRHYFVCVYCPKLGRLRGLAKCLQYLLLSRACRLPYRMPSQHLSRSHEAKALADRNNNNDQWGSELIAASAP